MPRLTDSIALELWNRALTEEIGVSFSCKEENKNHIRNAFYRVRQEAANPEHQEIIMVMPGPKPDEIWLCRKMVEL